MSCYCFLGTFLASPPAAASAAMASARVWWPMAASHPDAGCSTRVLEPPALAAAVQGSHGALQLLPSPRSFLPADDRLIFLQTAVMKNPALKGPSCSKLALEMGCPSVGCQYWYQQIRQVVQQ